MQLADWPAESERDGGGGGGVDDCSAISEEGKATGHCE